MNFWHIWRFGYQLMVLMRCCSQALFQLELVHCTLDQSHIFPHLLPHIRWTCLSSRPSRFPHQEPMEWARLAIPSPPILDGTHTALTKFWRKGPLPPLKCQKRPPSKIIVKKDNFVHGGRPASRRVVPAAVECGGMYAGQDRRQVKLSGVW
jgi:hypothetical protein